jgi:hypothetical protein
MKTKLFLILLTLGIVVAISCKKDSVKTTGSTVTTTQLDSISVNATTIYTQISGLMNTVLSKGLIAAADSGKLIIQPPSTTTSAKINMSEVIPNLKSGDGWYGPDADGWYYRSSDGVYEYREKFRCKDSTITYIMSLEASDGSYSNVTETQYTRHIKNKKVLYEGYTDWKIKCFSNNNISDFEWKFIFTDWNPITGAGTYDWYWGASSLGGNTVPFHLYMKIIATDSQSIFKGWDVELPLHVKVIWYNDGQEYWSFEYDTNWKPVEMPEMPCWL